MPDQPTAPRARTDAPALTHVRADGTAHMVDVSTKAVTARSASARGRVLLAPDAVAALRGGTVPKGDALAVARVAGIQAAKKCPDLVPLAHPVAVHAVEVDLVVADDGHGAAAPDDGEGHGLIGMRERALSVGGTFTAGPREGGGWRVAAHLPVGRDPAHLWTRDDERDPDDQRDPDDEGEQP